MNYVLIIIAFFVSSNMSGCFGGRLHYSKFQYYDVNKNEGANTKSEKKISVTISDPAYSQRWRNKYYVVITLNFYNTGNDTAIVAKNLVSLKIKSDSFFIRDDYTAYDQSGNERPLKLFKLPNTYKIPPQTSMEIPFQFDSYKKYSEKEYQDLYKNDTLLLFVGNAPEFKLSAKQKK